MLQGPQSSPWPRKACPSGKALGPWMGQLSSITTGHGLLAERSTSWKKTALTPSPQPRGLSLGPGSSGVACPHQGTWGASGLFPRQWEGVETGHPLLLSVSSFLRSFSHIGSFPSTQMHPGERGRLVHPPPPEGIGARGGGSRGGRIQRKSCVWGRLWHRYRMTHLKGP